MSGSHFATGMSSWTVTRPGSEYASATWNELLSDDCWKVTVSGTPRLPKVISHRGRTWQSTSDQFVVPQRPARPMRLHAPLQLPGPLADRRKATQQRAGEERETAADKVEPASAVEETAQEESDLGRRLGSVDATSAGAAGGPQAPLGTTEPLDAFKRVKAPPLKEEPSSSEDEENSEVGEIAAPPHSSLQRRLAVRQSLIRAILAEFDDSSDAVFSDTPKLLLQVRRERAAAANALAASAAESDLKGNGLRQRLAKELEAVGRSSASACGLPDGRSFKDVIEDEERRRSSGAVVGTSPLHLPGPRPALLGRIALSPKEQRLHRLGKLAALHRSTKSQAPPGMTEKERQRCQEVFRRHDHNRSGGLDLGQCHDALADLGLKTNGRKDRMVIKRKILESDDGELDFAQFCAVVHERTCQVRDAQRHRLMALFSQYDADDSGALSAEELLLVFRDLQLSPERDDERLAFLNAVVDADVDGSGEIEWVEFEALVQMVQQKITQCRHDREVRICEQLGLSADTFLNARHMLVPLHNAFRRFDSDGKGVIATSDVPAVLDELGLAGSISAVQEENCLSDRMIAEALDRELIDFAKLMQVVQRVKELSEGPPSLRRIFDIYDLDHSGSITENELLKMMRDLGMESWKDFAEVARLIDECDTDGNHSIEFEEFEVLFKRVKELHEREALKAECEHVLALGFSPGEMRELREIFDWFDVEQAGNLSRPCVMRALEIMGVKKDKEELFRKQDLEKLGRIHFRSFATIMREAIAIAEPAGKDGPRTAFSRLSLCMAHERRTSQLADA